MANFRPKETMVLLFTILLFTTKLKNVNKLEIITHGKLQNPSVLFLVTRILRLVKDYSIFFSADTNIESSKLSNMIQLSFNFQHKSVKQRNESFLLPEQETETTF